VGCRCVAGPESGEEGGAGAAGGLAIGGIGAPGAWAGVDPAGTLAGPGTGVSDPCIPGVTAPGEKPRAPRKRRSPARIGTITPPPPLDPPLPLPPGGGTTGERETTPGSNKMGW